MEHHWRYEKILSLEEAAKKAEELRNAGKKIVTANGSFDLLQAGHLDMLEEACQQGDVLFVGLNSDDSIREGKGEDRPIITGENRAALLAALVCVDYVVPIDAPYGTTHDVILETVKPHVHANGEEYGAIEEWAEWPMMEKLGVAGHAVKRRPNLSTSEIISKIRGE